MDSNPISFHGHAMELLCDRAIYWCDRHTLIVADLHLGKAATFRARGVPVPHGTTGRDLSRLSDLISRYSIHRLLVVGDLIHAAESAESLQALQTLKSEYRDLCIQLVRGNHDRHLSIEKFTASVELLPDPYVEAGLQFSHLPMDDPQQPTICGHLHPTVRLRDFDGSGLTVPCFIVDPMQIILPSFGGFTGGRGMKSMPNRRRYAAAAGRVVRVS